jgi:putative sterol carrier protein
LVIGKANAQQMFMKGKLKIKGNVMVAQKLGTLFKENSKL